MEHTTGLTSVDQCVPCVGGYYCSGLAQTKTSGLCSAGYFCTSGVDTPAPPLYENQTNIFSRNLFCPLRIGVGGPCPSGHFCPQGSAYPYPCLPGTYNLLHGQVDCTDCPGGYYCPSAIVNFSVYPCPSGAYCPLRSSLPRACLPGSFNPNEMMVFDEDCHPCPPGKYCLGSGLTEPTGNCGEGWYCTGGSVLPNSTSHGDICPFGYFCPEGSAMPSPCPPGEYCAMIGLALPQGPCTPGYFCINASSTADGLSGGPCTPGHFCPEGSPKPKPCPPGTFSPSLYNHNVTNCLSCPSGFFCAEFGLTKPTGPCSSGYYCPPNQDQASPTPELFVCPLGHFCSEGSSAPQRCPSGQYQPDVAQDNCSICPASYFCDSTFDVVILGTDNLCPEGYFCPEGTTAPTSYPCPPGTYSNQTGLTSDSQCSLCEPGVYCLAPGLTQPSGLCSAGYFCKLGAIVPTPVQGDEANAYPPGRYYPQGTIEPCLTCVHQVPSVTHLGLHLSTSVANVQLAIFVTCLD